MGKARLRVRTYDVVRRAVEEGVMFGLNRALKHADAVTRDTKPAAQEHIEREVMNALCEVVDFD